MVRCQDIKEVSRRLLAILFLKAGKMTQLEDSIELKPHHAAWLKMHPNRDAVWLRERFKDGFDVHHIDGDHSNNDGANLVLIEHLDHMRLHGAVMTEGRLGIVSKKGKKRGGKRTMILPDGRVIPLFRGERATYILRVYNEHPDSEKWSIRNQIHL